MLAGLLVGSACWGCLLSITNFKENVADTSCTAVNSNVRCAFYLLCDEVIICNALRTRS